MSTLFIISCPLNVQYVRFGQKFIIQKNRGGSISTDQQLTAANCSWCSLLALTLLAQELWTDRKRPWTEGTQQRMLVGSSIIVNTRIGTRHSSHVSVMRGNIAQRWSTAASTRTDSRNHSGFGQNLPRLYYSTVTPSGTKWCAAAAQANASWLVWLHRYISL